MKNSATLHSMHSRSALYRAIRSYFDSRNFLEVHTPLLAARPIPESHIDLFRTSRHYPDGTASPLFLLPSPELFMKRLLAAGAPSMYQISPCFRNGEQMDRWHRLEFAMLEWYTLDAEAKDNIAETRQLLEVCREAVRPATEQHAGPDSFAHPLVLSMEEAFQGFAGFSLEDDLRNAGLADVMPWEEGYRKALGAASGVLAARLRERGLSAGGADESAADMFHRLFLTLVEKELPSAGPVVLTDWPSLIPTLARNRPGTPWADRWEMYINGVEVANCYGEENSREALENYWRNEQISQNPHRNLPPESSADASPNHQTNHQTNPLQNTSREAEFNSSARPEPWIEQIAEGLPACSGVALGLDRLLALLLGGKSLEGVDLFPIHEL